MALGKEEQGRWKLVRTGAAIQWDIGGCVRTFKMLPRKKRKKINRVFYDGHCSVYAIRDAMMDTLVYTPSHAIREPVIQTVQLTPLALDCPDL